MVINGQHSMHVIAIQRIIRAWSAKAMEWTRMFRNNFGIKTILYKLTNYYVKTNKQTSKLAESPAESVWVKIRNWYDY